MSVIAVESLVQPIPGAAPCGENLEYGELRDLEVLAAGKPERQHGDKVLPAEEPSWPDIKQKAIEIFSRTKDLRAAALLTQALIRTDGLQGLKDGLELLAQL